MLQAVTFRIVPSEEFPSLPRSHSVLWRLLKTSCSSPKWAAAQNSHSMLFCNLQQPPERLPEGRRRRWAHGSLLGCWPRSPRTCTYISSPSLLSLKYSVLHKEEGMRWGKEDRTSPPEYPDPQTNTDDPTPFGYGGMIPPYLFHVEQSLQCLQIDFPFIISKTLQRSQNVALEKVEGKYRSNRNSFSNNI